MLVAPVHILLRATQCHNVALLALVWECDLHLIELFSNLPDVLSASSDDGSVESLINDNVASLLVFLQGGNTVVTFRLVFHER